MSVEHPLRRINFKVVFASQVDDLMEQKVDVVVPLIKGPLFHVCFGGRLVTQFCANMKGKLITNKMPAKIGDIYVAKTIGGIKFKPMTYWRALHWICTFVRGSGYDDLSLR
jgi:hypothetical protein